MQEYDLLTLRYPAHDMQSFHNLLSVLLRLFTLGGKEREDTDIRGIQCVCCGNRFFKFDEMGLKRLGNLNFTNW
ncbi:hypothetical protein D3C86_2170960 [compost metagenome]